MLTQVVPFHPKGSGFLRLRFPQVAGFDGTIYVTGEGDADSGRLVLSVWSSQGDLPPLDVVVEESEDGVTWTSGGTDGRR